VPAEQRQPPQCNKGKDASAMLAITRVQQGQQC
jgi:hypothetical protein